MIFPVKLALGLTILALPIAEVALLIKAGATFGFWPVFLWIIATAVLGSIVIQRSGLSIFSRIFAHIEAGGSGFEPMLDQLLTVTGGVLLIFPGLLGDAAGVLMLVPPVRWVLRRALVSLFTFQTYANTGATQPRQGWQTQDHDPFSRGADRGKVHSPHEGGPARGGRPRPEPPVIEGEYQRLDDKPERH
jgi:UPF0716 protein FxsA